jgi:glycosyltransferase involved in cell wall biosynthesis
MRSLEFVVPGDLQTPTGGYVYDRNIVAGLRALGWTVTVHSLEPCFPYPSANALAQADEVFAGIAAGARVIVDGLALGAMPQIIERHAQRLQFVALVHHPLAAETGLDENVMRALEESERRALQAVQRVVVTSAATRQSVVLLGVHAECIDVVEPGTHAAPLSRHNRVGALSILCVATIIPRKAHDLLVTALESLARYDWHLTCVGSNARSSITFEKLQRQLASAGLKTRVTLAGEVNETELAAYYRNADVFVLPTHYEGYGMAIAEALAHGLPVIATRTGAIADLLATDAGILIPPGNVDALRDALEHVMQRPDVLASMAEGARHARERLPRWKDACARMATVLERVAV